jgi:hypothetical protein
LVIGSFPDPLQRGVESLGKAAPEITLVGRLGDLPLYRLDHLDRGTLGGTIAFGSERDLAAQHGPWIAGIVTTLSPSRTVTSR